MNTLLIEDEPINLLLIHKYNEMLGKNSIRISAEARTISDATSLFDTIRPDLVLLDVHLSDGNGFDFLDEISHHNHPFVLIFITGYEQYALTAIKYNANNYLVKPFSFNQFNEAILKAKSQLLELKTLHLTNELINVSVNTSNKKIPFESSGNIILFDLNAISHIYICKEFSTFFEISGKKHIITESTKNILTKLPKSRFFRVHRNYIINKLHITSLKSSILILPTLSVEVPKKIRTEFQTWITLKQDV